MRKYILLQIIIAALLMASATGCTCQFEKRRYTGGYHKTIYRKHTPEQTYAHVRTTSPPVTIQTETLKNISGLRNEHATTGFKQTVNTKLPRLKPVQIDEPCDKIIFSDGSSAEVKVIETNSTDVIYRKCNDLSAPVMITSLKYVSNIEYANGERLNAEPVTKEVKNNEESQKQAQTQAPQTNKKIDLDWIINIVALIAALLGLMMLIFGFFFTWYWFLGAIILSALASTLGMIGAFRKGKALGILALIIGTICSILASVFIAIY
ncbi:MAG: hypothetical protein LC101_05890 [Flavobacteriales bacterium]|nr:hypothetical protein [Flavobacteriales bacterium]